MVDVRTRGSVDHDEGRPILRERRDDPLDLYTKLYRHAPPDGSEQHTALATTRWNPANSRKVDPDTGNGEAEHLRLVTQLDPASIMGSGQRRVQTSTQGDFRCGMESVLRGFHRIPRSPQQEYETKRSRARR